MRTNIMRWALFEKPPNSNALRVSDQRALQYIGIKVTGCRDFCGLVLRSTSEFGNRNAAEIRTAGSETSVSNAENQNELSPAPYA